MGAGGMMVRGTSVGRSAQVLGKFSQFLGTPDTMSRETKLKIRLMRIRRVGRP